MRMILRRFLWVGHGGALTSSCGSWLGSANGALRGYGSFVIAEKNGADFIGWCGVNHYVGMTEPGIQWALTAPHRGKGYMTEAGRTALDFAFQASNRNTLMTTIHPTNVTSQHTARRLNGAPTGEREVDVGETVDLWRFSRVGGAA